MHKSWHAVPLSEIFTTLKSRATGLTSDEALGLLKELGPNALPEKKSLSKLRLAIDQFDNPLMYLLLAIVGISFFLGHYSDTIFILVVILINTVVSYYQENKANESLLALKKMVKVRARVYRDGLEKEIDSDDIVVGDIIVLSAGNKIPADCRIIKSRRLKVSEASLTGESGFIEKSTADTLPRDRKSVV